MNEITDRLTKLEVEMTNIYEKSLNLDRKIDHVCLKLDNLKLWIMGVLAGVVGTGIIHYIF